MMRLKNKIIIWLCSLVTFLAVGLILEIATIGAEEYALFEYSQTAKEEAQALRTLNSFYFPVALAIHLLGLVMILGGLTPTAFKR